jgi:hypothetical protein
MMRRAQALPLPPAAAAVCSFMQNLRWVEGRVASKPAYSTATAIGATAHSIETRKKSVEGRLSFPARYVMREDVVRREKSSGQL